MSDSDILPNKLSLGIGDEMVIGKSISMQKLIQRAERAANSDLPVLITGPTGSGKEVIAKLIHKLGSPPNTPFLDVNCSAIPETLIESQLFGHEKGAFTGANSKQDGYFSLAADGVLFLDEIAELPLWQQTKLLRVLETNSFRRVGGAVNQIFRGRIVAATHVDLEKRVKEKRFREDLYYRLNVIQLDVPPLNQRREDIPLLITYFAEKRPRCISFTPAALKQLEWAEWRGNIRELKNTVEHMAVMSDSSCLDADEVRNYVKTSNDNSNVEKQLDTLAQKLLKLELPNKLEAIEYACIQLALEQAGGNKSSAARALGVHRKYIERRLNVFEKQLENAYKQRETAAVMMADSEYKSAITYLRKAIQSMECCISSADHDELKLDLLLKLSACLRIVYGWNNSEVVALYKDAHDINHKLDTPERLNSVRFGHWVNQLINLELDAAVATCASYWREGEKINNPNILAQAAISMANTQFWLGDYDQTCDYLQQFIDLYSHDQRIVIDLGHDPFAYYLMFKSLCSFQLGKVNTAIETFNALISYVREIDQAFSLATALQVGAWLHYKLGSLKSCYSYADELHEVALEYEFPFFEGMANIFRGHKIASEGDLKRGKALSETGYREKLNSGSGRIFNSMYGIIVADMAMINGEFQSGLEWIEESISISREHGELCYLAEELIVRGKLKMHLKQHEQAYDDYREGLAEAQARRSKAAELQAVHAIAQYHEQEKQFKEARRVLTPVVMRYIEQEDYLELADAKVLLGNIDKVPTMRM